MSTVITDVEYLESKSINFDWKFNVSSGSWTTSSNDFILKGTSSVCSLSVNTNYHATSNWYHNVHVTITFSNIDLMLNSIDLIMTHKPTQEKFIFCLEVEVSNPKVFFANKNIYKAQPFNNANQDWKVTIVYKNISRHEDKSVIDVLGNDFKELLESEKHTDFSIKTQNVTFKVHKGILSCRCNVLAKALESDMIEKQNSEIQLDMWDPPIVKELLLFLYTGSCEISLNPHQLFELANYYQLDELKVKCISYLQDNLNLKNIVHTLELADEEQYNLKDLQILALSFVEKNEATLVKDVDFQDYLSKSIKISNLVFVLRLACTYNLKGPLDCAKEFIKKNYEKVLENPKCKNYLLLQGELLLDILKSTLDSTLKA